jgi:membrane protein YdbS with pleckstrin-like domain
MKPLNRLISFILMLVMPFLVVSLFYDINVEKNGIIIYVSTLSVLVFFRMIPLIHDLINTKKKNLNGL